MLDCGVNNNEGYLERVEEGTGGVRSGVWLGGCINTIVPKRRSSPREGYEDKGEIYSHLSLKD